MKELFELFKEDIVFIKIHIILFIILSIVFYKYNLIDYPVFSAFAIAGNIYWIPLIKKIYK